MILRQILVATLLTLAFASHAFSEPAPDRLIGKVIITNPEKIDAKAKKQLAALATKIKKARKSGAVKIVGNVPSATSQDEFIAKAVFLARNIETLLKKQLSSKYQVFVTASKYSGEKGSAPNSVELYLYPFELKVEGVGFSSSQVTSEAVVKDPDTSDGQSVLTFTEQTSQDGLLSAPSAEDEEVVVFSKKERMKKETEDPALANELVLKAKARAAEKARRLELQK